MRVCKRQRHVCDARVCPVCGAPTRAATTLERRAYDEAQECREAAERIRRVVFNEGSNEECKSR